MACESSRNVEDKVQQGCTAYTQATGRYSYMSRSKRAANARVVIVREDPLGMGRVYHRHNLSVEARRIINIQCQATDKTIGQPRCRLRVPQTIVVETRLVAVIEVEVLPDAGTASVWVLVEVPTVEVLDEATGDLVSLPV